MGVREPAEIAAPAWVLAGAGTLVAAALATLFSLWTASSGWSVLRFLLAVTLLFLLPGRAVLALCRIRAGALATGILALLLGAALSTLAYWLLLRCGAAPDTPSIRWLPAALGGSAAMVLLATRRGGASPRVRWIHVGLLGVVALTLLPLVMRAGGYRDLAHRDVGRAAGDAGAAGAGAGGMSIAIIPDMAFHLGYIHELTRAAPPQVPFAAGVIGSYHYWADLLAAALARTMGLEIDDLAVRYLPTFWLALGVSAAFCFFRQVLRCGEAGSLLAAFLVVAGEDFSFLPGMMRDLAGPGGRGAWSVTYFSTPTIHSLYNYNPMLPGLALLFAALLCIASFAERAAGRWWVPAAILLAALCGCKLFAGALVLAAMGVVSLRQWMRHRDARWLRLLGVALLAALPLLAGIWRGNQAAARIGIRLRSGPYVQQAMREVGASLSAAAHRLTGGSRPASRPAGPALQPATAPPTGAAGIPDPAAGATLPTPPTPPAGALRRTWKLLCFAGIGLPLFLAGSLGARLCGVPTVWHEIAGTPDGSAVRQLVAAAIVLGALLTLGLYVSPRDLPPESAYNNSVWFWVTAKYLIWGFAVESVWRWCGGRGRRLAAAIALLLAASLPSAVQLLRQGWPPLVESEAGFGRVAVFLARPCDRGDVVLAPEPLASLLVGVPGCRSPLALPPLQDANVAGPELARRRADVAAFWRDLDAGRPSPEVPRRYRVRFVVIRLRQLAQAPPPPPLRLSLRSGDFAVYEVVDPPAGAPS